MSELRKIVLPIEGMFCFSCATVIEIVLGKLPGIQSVSVDYPGEKLYAGYDATKTSPGEMIRTLGHYGYKVKTIQTDIPVGSQSEQLLAGILTNDSTAGSGIIRSSYDKASGNISIEYIPGICRLREVISNLKAAGIEPHYVNESDLKKEEDPELHVRKAGTRQKYLFLTALIFTAPIMIYSMASEFSLLNLENDRLIMFILATLVQFGAGWQFYSGAFMSLRAGKANMDVLIMLGSTIAYGSSAGVTFGLIRDPNVYFETSAVIITLVLLGKYLESRAIDKSVEALKTLMGLRPSKARVIREGTETEIAVEYLRPGERIPADGVISEGRSSVDESMISGEFMPVEKEAGDPITGATINREGWLKFEVTKAGKDSVLSQIIGLVQEAQASKAPIQKLTDEIGSYFVPVVIGIALMTFAGWMLVAHQDWTVAMINAIAVLVIACPCAIGLATPTAVISGTTMGAKQGILFRNSTALEKAGRLNIVVLDKTGTLTTGKPVVRTVTGFNGISRERVLELAGMAEYGSEHPVGHAIVEEARRRGFNQTPSGNFEYLSGLGIKATAGRTEIIVGNERLMIAEGISCDGCRDESIRLQKEGLTVIHVAERTHLHGSPPRLIGLISLSDTLREGATEAVSDLTRLGMEVVMISGDNRGAAEAMARQLGIERVIAEVSPAEKAAEIRNLQEGTKGVTTRTVVAMVGDGINDAPALAQADVGIAIGTGTDVAMSAAGITLISGDPRGISRVISLSRLTGRTIVQNLTWALFYNIALVPIAAYGLLSPMFAAGAMAFSSLFVVTNSLRMKKRETTKPEAPKSFFREVVELTPRVLAPAAALAVLIILPMAGMPGNAEIKGVLPNTMTPLLMMVMAIANGLIAISYASIPVFLVAFTRKRKDLPFSWALVLFGAFILVCGTTHFVHIVGLWRNVDWWQAAVDSICAVISLATAVVVWPLLPKLLAIPSPAELRIMNRELSNEKIKLENTQAELRKAYDEVEKRVKERTAELVVANESLHAEIAERKHAEEELRVSEEKFKLYFQNSPLGKSITGLDGTIKVNKAFCNILGYSIDELEHIKWNEVTHPDDLELSNRSVEALLSGKEKSMNFEKRYIHKKGEIIWAEVNVYLQRDPQGQPAFFITSINNITERKKQEEEIRQLTADLEQRVVDRTRQLESINKELEAFSYSVSHDLRAPLRSIDGWSMALYEDFYDTLDEKGKGYIERVRKESQKMGHLIDDLLQLSRVTRSEMKQIPVDLSALAGSIVSRLTESNPDRKIDWVIREGLMANGDPVMIEVIMTNLMDNACKFTRKQQLARIELGRADSEPEQPFFVRDNGVGFDMEYAGKLFTAFQRMHKQSEFPGTGIGLATVQRIIHRHGGRLWAESRPMEGATFYFTLSSITEINLP
jgi:Cu+-exporting ATPase